MHKISYYLTAINISLVVLGVVALSFFVPRFQLDLTNNKLFSISPSTISFINNLKDVVRVDVYATTQLPPEVKPLTDNLKIILDNLSKVNSSKFIVTYFDPNKNSQALETAQKEGIRPLQFSSVKNDKMEIQNGYFGMVIRYGNEKEVLPVAGDIGNLEYYIVSAVSKLTRTEKTKVLVATGNGEWGQDQLTIFQKFLSAEYNTIPVNLNTIKELDNSARVLLLNGPKGAYNENALAMIKKWTEEKDKSLVVWLDQVLVNDNLGSAEAKTGLENLLAANGFELDRKFLIDEEAGVASFSGKDGSFYLKYAFWPRIDIQGINHEHPSVSGLSSATMAWSTVIKPNEKITPLLSSRKSSYLTEVTVDLNPTTGKDIPMVGNEGSSIVAAISKNSNKMIVVSDSDFIRDQFVVNNQQNLALGLNLIDFAAANENLISIRSKQIYSAPLNALTDSQKTIVRVVGIASSLVLLVLTYLVFFVFRKNKNNKALLHANKK